MKTKIHHSSSRRRTPWDECVNLTATQSFIKSNYLDSYYHRHKELDKTNEAAFINSFQVEYCRICGSIRIRKAGFTSNGIQRYRCNDCGKTFNALTGTLFENHKISILEWIEYLLNLFGYVSFSATSKNSKIADSTTKYWLLKLFEILKDYQDSIVLGGNVYIDETFYHIVKKERNRMAGNSGKNRYCIGIGYDGTNTFCKIEGRGSVTSRKMTLETFIAHIENGSTLIHDECHCHSVLVEPLSLTSKAYNSSKCKAMDEKDNPLQPINDRCNMLKMFLDAHRGFDRNHLQDYLNLFSFMSNPPYDKLEKIEYLFNLAMHYNKTIRYRDVFSAKPSK